MSLSQYKITDEQIAANGVASAPDKLTGSKEENKKVFDKLVKEIVKAAVNDIVDALAAQTGAGEIGAALDGVTGGTVQALLTAMKTLVDSKAATSTVDASLLLKEDKTVTAGHYKSVTFNDSDGKFTFTKEDGSTTVIDTALEKVVTNFYYDADLQCLVLTLEDGSTQNIDLSAFVTVTEFVDSEQIAFSISGATVTATIKAGSITDTMLASELATTLAGSVTAAAESATAAAGSEQNAMTYKNAAQEAKSDAVTAKTGAEQSALAASSSATSAAGSANAANASKIAAAGSATLSQSWAEGGTNTREGEDTNNAKYWAERAADGQIPADWNQTDSTKKDYIKNKPNVATKAANPTAGNLAGLDANGNPTDSGKKATDFANATHKAQHATSGSDALTPADIGAAADSTAFVQRGANAVTDLNDYKQVGAMLSTENVSNRPSGASQYGTAWNISGYQDTYLIQYYMDAAARVIYRRVWVDGGWYAWETDITSINIGSYASKATTYTATISAGWTASGSYFYKDVTVTGLLPTDNPIVDINCGSDNAANALYSECICKVFRIIVYENFIRLWATENIASAFPIQLKVVR